MSPEELTAKIADAVRTLAAIGEPMTGIVLHKCSPDAVAAAATMPGAKFHPYKDGLMLPGLGYLQVEIAGILVAFHEIGKDHAVASGLTRRTRGGSHRAPPARK